ncbi:MAG TPA: nitronate monooxygenase [Bryobacteraceae bacterium]|nr:nitronate monooxygenase [Bryobacteraceae bacterium]
MPGPSEFLKRLNIAYPIIQGPLGGGPSTPELVAAVSNAGGLGSLGAAYSTPDQIANDIARVRSLTSKPFQVNLFAGGWDAKAYADAGAMLEILAEIHHTLGIPPPTPPLPKPDPFPDQLEVVLAARPPNFSFTFGIPSPDAMTRLKQRGILIIGTATTVAEAKLLKEAGVDAVAAQGAQSAAHRGTFAGPFESSMIRTSDLVSGIVAAVDLPVIAAGGIMDGRDIVASIEAGASAAMLGTAFLVTDESAAPQAHKQAILSADRDNTVITGAFSGRPARGMPNKFIRTLLGRENAILPYPLQNALTRAMRTAAAQQSNPDFLSLWAGQELTRARSMPAAALVNALAAEMQSR